LKPSPRAGAQPWTAEIALRMRRHFVVKFLGTCAFTWLFFIAYFHLLRNPSYAVTTMPLIFLDRWIPFQPEALFAYLSLWFYIGFGPGLQRTFRELVVYGTWIVSMCAAGLVVFHFWPTAVPPMGFDASGYPGFAMLQGVDAAGNACPSMHVAAAMFTVIRIEHVLREAGAPWGPRAFNFVWFAAIAWSTVAIRQHVALDALAGALLGTAFALPSLRWRPRISLLTTQKTEENTS
jgi:membrane-associated phospholipid phosphatase